MHGVWWVPLAPIRDAALVTPAAARAAGASGDLAEHVSDKHMLFLFDNFEHLLDAATDVGGLLASCPNLDAGDQSVAASARANGTTRSHLPKPRPSTLLPTCTRFGRLQGKWRRCSDLRSPRSPTAIELAAARIKVLGVQICWNASSNGSPLAGGPRDAPIVNARSVPPSNGVTIFSGRPAAAIRTTRRLLGFYGRGGGRLDSDLDTSRHWWSRASSAAGKTADRHARDNSRIRP